MFEDTNESSFIEMTPLIINSFHIHKTMFIIIMPHIYNKYGKINTQKRYVFALHRVYFFICFTNSFAFLYSS